MKNIFKKTPSKEKDADGKVIVNVSKDEFKALIYLKASKGNGYEPDLKDALEEIGKKRVTYGLDEKLLNKIFEKKGTQNINRFNQ